MATPAGRGTQLIERARRRPGLVLLAAVLFLGGVLLTVWGWRLSFFLDDWVFLINRRGSLEAMLLDPHGENVVIGLTLVYRVLAELFGMSSAVPYRSVLILLVLVSSFLLFLILRTRIGDWLAAVAVGMIVFLGAAYEDLFWSIQIGYFIALTCGLGAFLALERRTHRADILACVLLTIGILSFSVGIPFAIGALVAVALTEDRWRRAWIVAIPIGSYALWWLGWGHTAESSIGITNIVTSPIFLLDGFASSLSSMLGLATPSATAIGALAWGRPLLAVAGVFVVYRLYRMGKVPPWLLVFAATAVAYWLLAGFNAKEGREPTVSRYQHIGAIFILLIVAELVANVRIPRPVTIAITVVAAFAVLSNLSFLHQARDSYMRTTDLELAGLGAVEIARATVDPSFVLDPKYVETGYAYLGAGSYLAAIDDYGSPGYTHEEIRDAPDYARAAADRTFGGALRLTFDEGTGPPAATGEAPAAAPGTTAQIEGGCATRRPGRSQAGRPQSCRRVALSWSRPSRARRR